ncbi:MAG: carbohydrate ABC transporter permease [Rhodobacteraceae bacterium]|nr:carbohydrate ABC transporter permease [Paracoccaceae bacterium]
MDNIAGQNQGNRVLVNITMLILVLLWLLPSIGLLVSSFRDRDQIANSGWWMTPFTVDLTFRARSSSDDMFEENGIFVIEGNVFADPSVASRFPDGEGTIGAFGPTARDLDAFQPGETAEMPRGGTLTVEADGSYRIESDEPIDRGPAIFFQALTPPSFTLDNYRTVLFADGMDRAFINTLTVAIPATIIPILIAAFAAYALAWMDFPGRGLLIAAVVGLLVVPLQLALVPLLNLHTSIGIGQSFLGIWLAHTGFGLPLAVYLLRNYMVGLPRDIIESAKVDGATDFQVFVRIILPLSFPALASFAIFQFLWTWNDLLVAKVFLPSGAASQVMTVKIADDLLGSRGGDWGILATAAFVSIAVPLAVFFTMQRYLVRGLLAGSVK